MSKQMLPPTHPKDCPHFGQELPPNWRCPPCPLAKPCFEAYENPTTFTLSDWTPPPNTNTGTTSTTTSPPSHA